MKPASTVARPSEAYAHFPGVRATSLQQCADLRSVPEALSSGWWAVVATFEGEITGWRFADVIKDDATTEDAVIDDVAVGDAAKDNAAGTWHGPPAASWRSSLDAAGYVAAVERIRSGVRDGEVEQANICRVLSAPLGEEGVEPDAAALANVLARGNPAPYAGLVHVPVDVAELPVWIVSASPELFLSVRDGRVITGPIKGTATRPEGLGEKDHLENALITDLAYNELQQVCLPGTMEVLDRCVVEHHPGLVHLVSRVGGTLRDPLTSRGWSRLLAATLPPASVSGAPKHSALALIAELETAARGPYCGAVGWIDVDNAQAELAVGIRTFWWNPAGGGTGMLHFGTGAGITWGSDARAEWRETELKAERLVSLASASSGGRLTR